MAWNPGHRMATDESNTGRRWTVVAIIVYCGIIMLLWLLPTLAPGPLNDYGEAWLAPARAIVRMVAGPGATMYLAGNPVLRGVGTVCVLGIPGLPFLGAFLCRSSLALWIVLLIVGVEIWIPYLYLVSIIFAFSRCGNWLR